MLELARLHDQRDAVVAGLAKRGFDAAPVDAAIALDDQRKSQQAEAEDLLRQANDLSKQIGAKMRAGEREAAEGLKAQVADLKRRIEPAQEAHAATVAELDALLLTIPNVPHPDVVAGTTPEENEVYRAGPEALPVLPEGHNRPHWELGEAYGLFSLADGVKLTGAGFPVYRAYGARLQRALVSYFLDRATDAGYVEVAPPHLVNADSARGTGQLPDKDGQMYYCPEDELYLIPTAEVPITNPHRGDILAAGDLPVKLCGYTPCFRREAGSYGKDVRGLNRVHQFDKVEIVRIEHPDHSYAALADMLAHVSGLLEELGLPYRILRLCGGDMGFTAAVTYDFEVWSAAQERWLEVSSVSNFETFQANRMALRIRGEGTKRLAHTLNGSALALPRIVAALLENNQGPEGIAVPEVLRSYTRFGVIPYAEPKA